jgi:hypothetical protein
MSKRQSDTSTQPNGDTPVIFLDENIGSPGLVEELRTLKGWTVEYQLERLAEFPRGMKDPELFAACGRRGWIIVTCDDRFRYKQGSKTAVTDHCVKAVVFPEGQYSGLQYRSALVVAQQRILAICRQYAGAPCLIRILVSGEIRIMNDKPRSEMTAKEKTARKYGAHVLEKRDVENGV